MPASTACPGHAHLPRTRRRPDFDSQIVVKINIGQVLIRELARPSWSREPVAMGTNTDPYQRAEGRYRLMPEVITALAGSCTPFSILTKGTMISRDLPLLAQAATQVPVSVSISLALLDPQLHGVLEPGTPSPRARLELVRRIRAAGLPCGVLIAPILPHLTDAADDLERLVGELAAAGATSITGIPLRLMTGAREWFFAWLEREHPELVSGYRQLYAGGANMRSDHRRAIQQRLARVLSSTRLDHHPDARELRLRSSPHHPMAPSAQDQLF